MKKLIIICLVLIFCSACTNINYRLTFNSNGKINEDIIVLDKNINHLTSDDPFEMDGLSAFEFFFQSLPYNSGYNGSEYYAKKDFKNFDEFLNDSLIFDKFYHYEDINVDGKKIRVDLKTNDVLLNYIKNGNIDSIQISLYIPYYVSKHNANKVENNTYIWEFDDLETANLKINFDMSKSYKHKGFLISILVTVVLSVVIISIIIYFVYKNKKSNEL